MSNEEDMTRGIDGKNYIVIGALAGIGYAAAYGLASRSISATQSLAVKETSDSYYQHMVQNRKTLPEGTPQSFQEGWDAAKKDINTLKFEILHWWGNEGVSPNDWKALLKREGFPLYQNNIDVAKPSKTNATNKLSNDGLEVFLKASVFHKHDLQISVQGNTVPCLLWGWQ
ncbi:hypothetical protein Tco_0317588 [Tanacetum coccineum]